MRTALLFPGQGAPAREWREVVVRWCPDLLQHARELLGGEDPFERFGEGTEFDQPAIYCASLTAFELAGRPDADFHAGHSLGEIAALACAGALAEHDGLRLVAERGRLMAAAALDQGGSMVAVRAGAEEVAELAGRLELVIANHNAPAQTVLSGADASIERAEAELAAVGVKAKRLPVIGAFHSPRMAAAAEALRSALERIDFAAPRVPVLSSRTGRPFADPRSELATSVTEPVRWIDVVQTLDREGVDRFVEIGPGKALAGLVRRSLGREAEIEATPLPELSGA